MSLWVFGYGSLMYEPEAPGRLRDLVPATLPGWSRAFNKRSLPRGCPEADALLPAPLPGWSTPDRRVSLCLGTSPSPGAAMVGRLLRYDAADAREVLAALDRREGVDAVRPGPQDSYVRAEVTVLVDGRARTAITYLTRTDGVFHAPGLSLAETASILAHATPRTRGDRARGADYLLEAQATLARAGVEDPDLDRLAAATRARLRGHGRFA